MRDHTRLRIVETRSFGHDNAETPERWRHTFLIRLAHSEAGFRVGYLAVQQFAMAERLGH